MESTRRPPSGSFPEVVHPYGTDSPEVSCEDGLHLHATHPSPASSSKILNDEPPNSTYISYSPSNSGKVRMHDFHKTSRKTFALLCGLAVFLFTAIALSTGLGIPLAKCRNELDPEKYAPLAATDVVSVQKGKFCNSKGVLTRDAQYNVSSTFHFDLYCGREFQRGGSAFDPVTKSGIPNGTVQDIMVVVAYSVPDCINACASMNLLASAGNSTSPPCQSVTFLANMKDSVASRQGNCFLKNATINDLSSAESNVDAVSAEVHRLRKSD